MNITFYSLRSLRQYKPFLMSRQKIIQFPIALHHISQISITQKEMLLVSRFLRFVFSHFLFSNKSQIKSESKVVEQYKLAYIINLYIKSTFSWKMLFKTVILYFLVGGHGGKHIKLNSF